MVKKQDRNVRRTMHYYWRATMKHKAVSLITFILTPIVYILRDVAIPFIVASIMGSIATNPSWDYISSTLIPLSIFCIVLKVITEIMGEIRVYTHWKMEIYAMYELGNEAFDVVSAQSMQFHNNRFSGSLVSQTNKFIGSYERLFDTIIWSIVPLAVIIISSLGVLFVKSPIFAAILTLAILLYLVIAFVFYRKMEPLNQAHAKAENKQTGQLSDSISNIISVKSYANEAHEHHRYANFNRATANTYTDLLHANIKRNVMFDGIYVIFQALVIIFALIGQQKLGLDFTVVYLIVTYTSTISTRLWDINHILKDLNRVFGDAYEMTEILDMKDDVVDLPDAKELVISDSEINFDNISFKHADAKEAIFTDFNLKVHPGERIGLVGISGSGKTTLTKLLLRFADVDAGEIDIDGQKSLRKAIAYVPQETSLFHRSIAENIAYGKPDATSTEIERAAKLANAHEFIKDLPNGYETLVGERGVKLSGGQRQRIAIARAILKDAPILVLDEATSALDSESEALIQEALSKLMKGRTSIVVAHRLSTIASLDRIVVLKDGEIAEMGTHAELLKSGGAYAKLWSRQSGAFLKEDN